MGYAIGLEIRKSLGAIEPLVKTEDDKENCFSTLKTKNPVKDLATNKTGVSVRNS